MIQWDLVLVTSLVIGIVIWAILQLRHTNRTNLSFEIPSSGITLRTSGGAYETLQLPQAGTTRGPATAVALQSNVLVFRSQMKSRNGTAFQFPSPGNLDSQLAKLFDTSGRRGQTLQDQKTAVELNLPWPPEASAQLITYYEKPLEKPSITNELVSGPNKLKASQGAGTYPQPFPLADAIRLNQEIVTVGYPGANTRGTSKNFVLAAGISTLSSAYNAQLQTSTQLEAVVLEFQDTGVVQVECAGGNGGSYLGGVGKSAVNFQGGRGGLSWAYVSVSKGDIWQVQLAQNGAKLTPAELQSLTNPSNSSFSGGGLGSFLAGSEGGGSTWISSRYPKTPNGPLPNVSAQTVFLCAGGGGGASRNAFGGSAGLSLPPNQDVSTFFGSPHPNPIIGGFPGGPVNAINEEDIQVPNSQKQQVTKNGLSGGGGSNTKAGESYTSSQLHAQGYSKTSVVETSKGSILRGGNGSENPPGGGGGGSGIQGGGSGVWNGLNAPNNEHGAGGGGASSTLRVTGCTNATIVNRNPYQTTSWPNAFQQNLPANVGAPVAVFDASSQFLLAIPAQEPPFVNRVQTNPNVLRNRANQSST